MPINKLLISMSLPIIASMLVQALYNIVDSIFVAMINQNALTSVSLAFPLQTFMISMGMGIGVGMNALLSRCLGANDKKGVKDSALNGIFIMIFVYIIFLIPCIMLIFYSYVFFCRTIICIANFFCGNTFSKRKIFPKGDCQSLNYQEKYSRR